jgi:hypothetical protein
MIQRFMFTLAVLCCACNHRAPERPQSGAAALALSASPGESPGVLLLRMENRSSHRMRLAAPKRLCRGDALLMEPAWVLVEGAGAETNQEGCSVRVKPVSHEYYMLEPGESVQSSATVFALPEGRWTVRVVYHDTLARDPSPWRRPSAEQSGPSPAAFKNAPWFTDRVVSNQVSVVIPNDED